MKAKVLQGNFLPQRILQRKGGSQDSVNPAQIGINSLPGRPLPQNLSATMSQALGQDLSDVRIHIGPQAAAIGALAFTMGSDIYFAPGQYQPDTARGLQILGHELAHVVQQKSGRVRAPTNTQGLSVVIDPVLENEADRLGHLAAATAVQLKSAHPAARNLPIHGAARNLQPKIASRNIQPLVFWRRRIGPGNVAGTVAATEQQLADWVETKIPDAERANINHCVQYFLAHDGKLTGGGTGMNIGGRTVFHISHGRADRDDGCTLFFTVAPGIATPVGNVGYSGLIVAIGRHNGTTNYRIRWNDVSWPFGNQVNL